ncbi:MAG: YlxR family protein [Candidatus Syntrophonatronum acetioxidans]|uniref:YlxR family protein n=1 Tax=Candidatus Syntrophonatronum acetioxidans TaxID=1795816 RepID=A0A424YD82_9FIRM|nr:MAG: YlxR family protein [Candidatus Syntrophonatronum acetioxidans]
MARKRKVPLRVCIGCQRKKPKKELIRIVRTPEDSIEVDFKGKRSGRGTYICPDKECLKSAVKGKRIEKNLQRSISPEVMVELEKALEKEDES